MSEPALSGRASRTGMHRWSMPDMGAVPLTMRLSVVALAAALSAIPRPQVAQETPEPGRYGGALHTPQLGGSRTLHPILARETSSTDFLLTPLDRTLAP